MKKSKRERSKQQQEGHIFELFRVTRRVVGGGCAGCRGGWGVGGSATERERYDDDDIFLWKDKDFSTSRLVLLLIWMR